ncbi:MAG: N-6 DNA methylase [Cytophagales bacterium]|nr:N-6 DNA methylase [Cytophagales bacterium]
MPRDRLTQPLFNPKLVRSRFAAPATVDGQIPPEHKAIITQWAQDLKGSLAKESEVSVRPIFLQRFFESILGYTPIGSGAAWTLHHEQQAQGGSVDAALGVFTQDHKQTLAAFELKGPKTTNLDALMPGRHKSPVQQAWDYANDLPGSQFILVSNCNEIRLYAHGWGRAVYESWHVADLLEPANYASFVGLLGAERLTSGASKALLAQSVQIEKEITQKLYLDYKQLRSDLIVGLAHLNPAITFTELVRLAQKLIDRLLFMAFAQSRGLLPRAGELGSIEHAASHTDGYNPQPRWINFLALFRAVDAGNPFLKIPPYNGGLFAPDAALDGLVVSDKLVANFTQLSGYDYEAEVSVTVLGRIFEQSIADLEKIAEHDDIEQFKLSADSARMVGGKSSVSGKRKREGVVYTPDHITRFIVEQTLTPTILDRFNECLAAYQDQPNGSEATSPVAWRGASKEEMKFAPPSVLPENVTEYHFWQAWQAALSQLRVCDPACGSGAFLVASFDVFKEAYTQVHLRLRELAPQELLTIDISHQILECNLFGVDINPESIEITKLSLWLKTAERGRKLAGLEANFYQGNSLVSDTAVDSQAYDWRALGQFDCVVGNPPYVRQELFSNLKPYLEAQYKTYHGAADLFAYFYELGLNLLHVGGRLGFISSSSFFKSSSGEPLRRLLRTQSQIEVLVDFGDWQVFEGVTTYPAVLVTRQIAADEKPNIDVPVRYLQLTEKLGADMPELKDYFAEHAQNLALGQLGGDELVEDESLAVPEWQLEDETASKLRAKLVAGHKTLKETLGSPLYGVKTGLNEAFVIDRATRDKIVYADITCEPLLKPFLRGDDIERWRIESQDLWLILLPKGWTFTQIDSVQAAPVRPEPVEGLPSEQVAWQWLQKKHPSLAAWLEPFADAARKRTDQGDYWWELRACAYYDKFETPKILYPDIAQGGKFFFDEGGSFFGNTAYFIPNQDLHCVALLNSKVLWFYMQGICEALRGGQWRLRMFTQHIETLPIPEANPAVASELALLASAVQQAARDRLQLQRSFAHRVLDLTPSLKSAKAGAAKLKPTQLTLSEKLKNWWQLENFRAFSDEIKHRFKQDIPFADRTAWETLFTEQRQQVLTLDAQIATLERSINTLVYALFDLSESEIRIIEAAVS